MFAGIPDFRAAVLRSVRDGDTVWSEWHWTGTRRDGLPFDIRGITLFEIAGDHIVAGRLYMEEVERDMVDIAQTVEDLSGQRPDQV
jgi:ketosteroid isomerase-like protein